MTLLPFASPPKPLALPTLNPYRLGATLYMPATRSDIWEIISRQKLPHIDSIVLCLEDAITDSEVVPALANLAALLATWQAHQDRQPFERLLQRPLVCVRPRNAMMLAQLSNLAHIACLDGFVLPKIDMSTLADWRVACQDLPSEQFLMPTLETRAIFNPVHNHELALALTEAFYQSILALRVGGNDLFACLRLRRPASATVYQSPVGALMYQLIACFVPYGFYLTAPVFEYLDKAQLLAAELRQDVELGFVGKTIIHPTQIDSVKQAFGVSAIELSQAQAILAKDAKAVFKQNDSMLEPATHRAWATHILLRAQAAGNGAETSTGTCPPPFDQSYSIRQGDLG